MSKPNPHVACPAQDALPNALSILDALDALVYVADMDTHEILFANRRACRDLGPDLVGRICWQALQKNQEGPCPFCTNHLLRDADGKALPPHTWEFRNTRNGRWYHIVDQAMPWADGRLVRVEVATDITANKQADEELKAKHELLNSVFRSAPYALLLVDREGKVVCANKSGEPGADPIHLEMLGLLGGEVLHCMNAAKEGGCGRTMDCLDCPVRTRVMRTFATGEGAYNAEALLVVRKDGQPTTVHFLVSTVLVRMHGEEMVLVSLADVTERKRAEAALTESEARFRSVVEATPLGIHFYEMAADGTLVFTGANPAADKILGIRHADLVGLPMEQAFPAHQNTELPAVYRRVAARGDRFAAAEYAYEDKRIMGDYDVWAFQTLPGRMAAMFMDVSERRRASAELMAAKLAAEESNRAKSEFLATMSHEIRTPLNGVMGMLQLAAGEELSPEVKGYLDTALRSSRNLLRVLSDILDLSRIEAGALPIEAEAFDLESVLTPVVEAFRPEARTKGLALDLAVDAATPARMVGDAGRIRQVLFNLVANAVKYCEAGFVRVEAYPLARFARPGTVALHLVVADSGPGIPDEQLRRAFEPFSQVDGSSTRRHGGAGLGLAIVRRLVGLMQGTLAYCSEPGRGTEAHLTLWLPLSSRRLRPEPGRTESPERVQGARVLVVEDEPVNRMAVTLILKKLGMSPTAAENGQAALLALGRQEFDCVLMDIQMPGMDGLEVTRHIRAAKPGTWSPSIPVLALTAHAMKGDQERFLAAGMDGYIAKPVDMEELRRAIEAALNMGA